MKLHKLLSFVVGLALALPSASYAAFEPATQPLFLGQSVKHNLLFIFDDSGSMDFETLRLFDESPEEGYLFYNEAKTPYDGRAVYSGRLKINAEKKYLHMRSSIYNLTYYDPDETYIPWIGYSDASATSAKYDPNFNGTTDLTKDVSSSDLKRASYFVKTESGRVLTDTYVAGYACPSGQIEYQKNCYVYDGSGSEENPDNYDWVGGAEEVIDGEEAMQCASPNSNLFDNFADDPDGYYFTGDAEALGPDGACLKRVEIANGSAEIQNFANWFTYYRRRHHATRAAIGEAVKDLERMNLGMFYLHSTSLRGMYDSDTELDQFLAVNYGSTSNGRFGSGGGYDGGGTPLRSALKRAGVYYNDSTKDIIKYECQRNYTLLFTDGFTTGSDSVSGIGNADKDDGAPFADNKSGTMADIARYYYKQRLRTDLPAGKVRLPDGCQNVEGVSPLDCNKDLHMTTYTVGMGAKGEYYAGLGAYTNIKAAFDNPPDWDKLDLGDQDNDEVDDLYHAAVNGHGEFFQADSTAELRTALKGAIDKLKAQEGSGSAATFNSGTLKEGAKIYAGGFNSGDWSGSLVARNVNATTGESAELIWAAEDELDARDFSADPRVIVTGIPDTSGASTVYNGAAFAWSNLTPEQQAALQDGDTEAVAQQRLAFTRGDRSQEDGPFRKRGSRLGDIVGSAPVYVGEPMLGWTNSAPFGDGDYAQFKSDNKDRAPMVYAGANDGMLHGFDAETGQEKLAYVPSTVYSKLRNLTDPDYQHEYSVDLTPIVSDVYIEPRSSNQESWRTVLVGGMGMGGGGLFALDVTNPGDFSESNADDLLLWEFNDPRMGVITDPPVISMVEWADGDYRWVAIFGNGYGTDETGLFMLDMNGGADGWVENSDYRFIELANGGGGLSAVRLGDIHDESEGRVSDGIGDAVYAGDRDGNLWVIDGLNGFNKTPPTQPLFTTANNQPITSAPILSRHTEDAETGRNVMVFFGTGQYLQTSDLSDNSVQSFYGVWDKGTLGLTQSDLAERDLAYDSDTIGVLRNVVEKEGEVLDWSTDYGWYFDFDTPAYVGERVVMAPQIRKGYLFFDTTIPTGDACSSGGQSFLMSLTLDGLDPDKPIFDTNGDGEINSDDKAAGGYLNDDSGSAGSAFIGNVRNTRTTTGGEKTTEYDLGSSDNGEGRASWREVLN